MSWIPNHPPGCENIKGFPEGYPEKRQKIINDFLIYLRTKGHIILDAVKIVKNDEYKNLIGRLYMTELIKNPKKFILVHNVLASIYSTESNLNFWDIKRPRDFDTYYYCLFFDRKTTKCVCSKDIFYLCNFCCDGYCRECLYEFANGYYVGCNIFRCRNCRNVLTIFE